LIRLWLFTMNNAQGGRFVWVAGAAGAVAIAAYLIASSNLTALQRSTAIAAIAGAVIGTYLRSVRRSK
jgi:uncharacterized membrane protein YjjB (DUF3815 family)